MEKNNVKPGQSYLYKTEEGRGRPFVGKVIDVTARRARLVNRANEVVNVPFGKILSTYSYKPHKKLRKDAEQAPNASSKEAAPQEAKRGRGRPRKNPAPS